MKRASLAVLSTLMFAAPAAQAADMALKAPPAPPPIFSWTGCYIGGNAGGSWQRTNNSLSVTNNPTAGYFFPAAIPGVNASGTGSLNSDSFTVGAQIGCNYQIQNFVWGAETDINWLHQNPSNGGRSLYTTNGAPYFLTFSDDKNWFYTLRGRVGLAADHALFYLTGGLAATNLRFQQTFSEPPFTPTPEVASDSTRLGWTIGVGAEYAFTNNWSVKGEYLYARFQDNVVGTLANGSGSGPGCVAAFACGATFTNSVTTNLHFLRAGLNYRFGGPM